MKKVLFIAAALVIAFTAAAQPQGQGPQGPDKGQFPPKFEQRDPEQVAKEQTDRLDELVSLTPKQYKKIFKFNKKMEKQRQSELENMMPQGRPEGFQGGRPDFGGERPPMGQGRPGGMGPGGPGGMGPGGQGGRPPRGDGQFRGPRNEEMEEFMEKQNEKRDKEYSKILTPEQYQRWKSVETEREFRRMIE